MVRLLLLTALLFPLGAAGQSLAGDWAFDGATGTVRLTLAQQASAITGTMIAPDGSVFVLDGALEEGGGATGSVRIGDGAGWFALGLVGEGLKVVVAEVDPSTGEPDLASGWELDFVRVGGGPVGGPDRPGAGAQTPTGHAPQGASGPGGVPPQDESSPLLREWLGHLRGAKLSYRESYYSSDIGGSGGYSNRWDAWLCSDGTFHFQEGSSVSIDTGGALGSSAGGNTTRGIWRLAESGGQVVLQYQMEGAAPEYAVMTFQDGATFLDGSRVYVTRDDPLCY